MGTKIKIGTRPSQLALKQVEEIIAIIGRTELEFEIVRYKTTGDIDKITSLSVVEGTDFFTDAIEQALLKKEIDIAVHSAKDLPDNIPVGLKIALLTKSLDPHDALVTNLPAVKSLNDLPAGSNVACSSLRRTQQLQRYRDDLEIVDVRGNIDERIEKLDRGQFDGLIVAACALIRLGLEDKIAERIPFEIMNPHPLQGCLAVETREDNPEITEIFRNLKCPSVDKWIPAE